MALSELSLEAFTAENPIFKEDVFDVFDWEASVEARLASGGTALESVDSQLLDVRTQIEGFRS